jgi:hypothetical protein
MISAFTKPLKSVILHVKITGKAFRLIFPSNALSSLDSNAHFPVLTNFEKKLVPATLARVSRAKKSPLKRIFDPRKLFFVKISISGTKMKFVVKKTVIRSLFENV